LTIDINNPNAELLRGAIQSLGVLLEQVVLVGGCATGLLITDPAAAPIRPTIDVDLIVDFTSLSASTRDPGSMGGSAYVEYVKFSDRLRTLGFNERFSAGDPICRWSKGDLVLDVMPSDPSALGFTNRWYLGALKHSELTSIGEYRVRVITAPYFVATKFEAFHQRGKMDYRLSRDLEDIISVVDGRAELSHEVTLCEPELRMYLSKQFSSLLLSRDFLDALPGYLLPDNASQRRIQIILGRLHEVAKES
jgi:hypothetical protein